MIYITLPNLYKYQNLKLALCRLNKNILKMKIPMHFVSEYESFPYCYLGGGVNVNNDFIFKYHQLETKAKVQYSIAKRLNFSNLNIEEKDIKDEYFNIILQLYDISSWIEVSNIPLAVALKNKYPFYELILSENADIMFPFTSDAINTIQEQDLFKLISIPTYYNDNLEFLKQIQHRSKLELTINNICNNCPVGRQKDCILTEHNGIYNYSKNSIFKSCTKFYSYTDPKAILITLEDIQNKYLPLGITHYKLNNFPNLENEVINFVFFIVNYFIKDEYKNEILLDLLKEINNESYLQ